MLQLGISCWKAPALAIKSLLPASALTRLSIVGRQGFCVHDTRTQHPCMHALQPFLCVRPHACMRTPCARGPKRPYSAKLKAWHI